MLVALDSGTSGGYLTDPDVSTSDLDTAPGVALLCASCRSLVTRKEYMTEIGGTAAHTCTNPHGFTYTFHTFAAAPGCMEMGEPTTEHTWFPPFAWRMACCRGCRGHLGWRFDNAGGASFYGLIADRLMEDYLQ